MAISNYSELVTAVGNHLHRSDLGSVIPDFITLAEEEMNTRLRLDAQITVDDLTCTGRYTALPSDLLELRSVEYAGSPVALVPFGTPEYLTIVRGENDAGLPRAYSIRGGQIELWPTPSSAALNLTYYAKVGPLTANTPTTAVLTRHPALYLYGVLRQASVYTRDAELGAAMGEAFDAAIGRAQQADERRKYPGPLAMKVA